MKLEMQNFSTSFCINLMISGMTYFFSTINIFQKYNLKTLKVFPVYNILLTFLFLCRGSLKTFMNMKQLQCNGKCPNQLTENWKPEGCKQFEF